MYSQTQRLNPMYSNISNINGPTMNNQFIQHSQMNQYQPITFYPQQSQYLVHSGYLPNMSNNCTQENFSALQTISQLEDNKSLSFSEMVKNNLECGLKKIPENISNCLMEKIHTKLQRSNHEISTFRKKLNDSNYGIEKKLLNLPNCLEIVEAELNEINSKLMKLKELIENNKNQIDLKIKKKQNEFLDRIAFERENEKRLLEYIDQIETLKLNVSESIIYAENEMNNNMKMSDSSMNEIKFLLCEKFKDLEKELCGIKRSKTKIFNLNLSNEVNIDSSVKKINELKTFINQIQKNDKIKEIKKESFCLLAHKENNKNVFSEKIIMKIHKKGSFKDFSFFEI